MTVISGKYPSRIRMRRLRQKAEAHGLCPGCCKQPPAEGRTRCTPCNDAAKVRIARMRVRQREQRMHEKIIRSYEAAGDIAFERFAYVEASGHYENALTESGSAEDEVRLCRKIGQSLFYGARPDFATSWYQRALERCQQTQSLHAMVPTIMRFFPRQLWLELRTTEALEYSFAARKLAIAAGDTQGVQYSDTSIGNLLVQLGRYEEAQNHAPVFTSENESAAVRSNRFNWHAMSLASQGQAPAAFAEFERAIDAAKELLDGYFATATWDDYANWATALGRLDIARACRERALLVARERRITWRIPYLTLRLASTLVTAGDYEHARDLVRDALTYDTDTPVIRVLLATVGIETALRLRDTTLLERTIDEEAIDIAIRSEEGERIAPIVAAYVKVHASQGNLRRAKALIARALPIMKQADNTWDLLAIAGRYGSPADRLRARDLLQQRLRLPHHQVAQAYLALWECYQFSRDKRERDTQESHIQQTARLFTRLGRKHQHDEALGLLGRRLASGNSNASILSMAAAGLTTREQQVAELVLRGLTNRAIARALSISEHTVETHMTSVLNRLGLRSRYQLIERGGQS